MSRENLRSAAIKHLLILGTAWLFSGGIGSGFTAPRPLVKTNAPAKWPSRGLHDGWVPACNLKTGDRQRKTTVANNRMMFAAHAQDTGKGCGRRFNASSVGAHLSQGAFPKPPKPGTAADREA